MLVIVGRTLAKLFDWLRMDPLAGLVDAGVIASWSYGLIRDTARVLLDRDLAPTGPPRARKAPGRVKRRTRGLASKRLFGRIDIVTR